MVITKSFFLKKFKMKSIIYSFNRYLFTLLFSLLLVYLPFTVSAQADTVQSVEKIATKPNFSQTITLLKQQSFKKKTLAINKLSKFNQPEVTNVLEAFLNGNLYYRKQDKKIVIAVKTEQGYQLTDAINNKTLDTVKKNSIKKIKTNNKLRSNIRGILARKKLTSSNIQVRQKAIDEILKTVKPILLPALKQAKKIEKESSILDSINLAIALIEIETSNKILRVAAVKQLGSSLHPIAISKLNELVAVNDKGEYLETNKEIVTIAEKAIKQIGYKQSFYSKLETLFFGLSLGSVLLLVSIGLAITFGVMGVINMAHGELMMLGAYTTYLVQQLMPNNIDLSLIVAVPSAFIISGLFGMAIERGIIRHLYGRPLETLLATFGISLLLQQLVRTAISAQNVAVETPSWLSGSLIINPMFSITYNRLYILIFALLVFFLLLLLLKKTTLGLQVRAVAQNRGMAKAMGIKTQWIDSLTFGLGSGVAGIAGVALSQLTNVGPNLGQTYIIDSFMVVVFGGVESLWGTLVAAMTLGIANKFIEPWAGAVMAKIIVLIFLILFIQKRPKGLFPQKGRSSVGS
jgi:urea transport system permease protein